MKRDFKQEYNLIKQKLLLDKEISKENKDLFKKFFEEHEYKLKRKTGLRELDHGNYRTLYGYVVKFRIVDKWFSHKPWVNLTKEDIQSVYDKLEDGKIKRVNGKPYENLDDSYYSKIFKSRPFELAGKDDIAREVIRFKTSKPKEVRFITEDDFKKILNYVAKPEHKLLVWLAWDIGENIQALLQLKKSDFFKQINQDTKEPEYRVNLRREILKRSRRPRSEITNYPDTAELLNQILPDYKDDDLIFKFGYGGSKKIIDNAVARAKVKCIPGGEKVTWKDLRSGMACDLLKKGYSVEEINNRLGHKPSSDEIDKYINFLAIDRHKPKKKVEEYTIKKLQAEVEEYKERDKLKDKRYEQLSNDMEEMKLLVKALVLEKKIKK